MHSARKGNRFIHGITYAILLSILAQVSTAGISRIKRETTFHHPVDPELVKRNRECKVHGNALNPVVASTVEVFRFPALFREKTSAEQQRMSYGEYAPPGDSCRTPQCKAAAEALLGSINQTADPCDDFYQYTCGKWIEQHPLSKGDTRESIIEDMNLQLAQRLIDIIERPPRPSDSKALGKARVFYQSCTNEAAVNEKGLDALIGVIQYDFPGWPMAGITPSPSRPHPGLDLASDLGNLYTIGAVQSLLTIYVDENPLDPDHRSFLVIDQALLGLVAPEYYLDPSLSAVLEAYTQLIIGVAKLIRDIYQTEVSDEQISADARDLVAFETRIAAILTPWAGRRDVRRWENVMTIRELQASLIGDSSKLQVLDLLNHLGKPAGLPSFTADTEVIVWEKEFMAKLGKILASVQEKTLANYITWWYIYSHASYVSANVFGLFERFDQVALGLTTSDRSFFCISQVSAYYAFALAGPYAKDFFPQPEKKNLEKLASDIESAFRELLQSKEVNWMDSTSKSRTISKLDALKPNIAYPEEIFDNTILDAFYSLLDPKADAFFENIYQADQFAWAWFMWRLVASPDSPTSAFIQVWKLSPLVVNAAYFPGQNEYLLPMAVIQDPLYAPNRPQSLNYGAIGFLIGHEITHGFGRASLHLSKETGKLESNIWSPQAVRIFESKTQCFIQQYSQYTFPELVTQQNPIPPRLDGKQTLEENLADNGGIRLAVRAFRRLLQSYRTVEQSLPGLEHYSPQQLLLINAGYFWCENVSNQLRERQLLTGVHSPPKFRVIGEMSNLAEFANAFSCKSGDKMVRSGRDTCRIY